MEQSGKALQIAYFTDGFETGIRGLTPLKLFAFNHIYDFIRSSSLMPTGSSRVRNGQGAAAWPARSRKACPSNQ
jgi:hypothetical protein